LEESPAHFEQSFPGDNLTALYKEGLLVGYRWYDTKAIAPLFPFGYGLSYSSFSYSGLHTDKKLYTGNDIIKVMASIKNDGKMAGKETLQLYVSKPGSVVERAEKELKSFTKVSVPAGKEVAVSLAIPVKDLAYYDEQKRAWIVEPGQYKLMAGSSSRDIRAVETISIHGGK
jgi:beta-glucosidase